jgi:hypothetical protein
MCLTTMIRPSSMIRMTVPEVEAAKKRESSNGETVYVVRVYNTKAKANNAGYVVFSEEVYLLIKKFISQWRPSLLNGDWRHDSF